MRKLAYIFMITVLFSSCHSLKRSRTIALPDHSDATLNTYVSRYADLAMSEMRRTGVPASITLAQGIIESDYGRSRLAREANNHFGIKCHKGWTGKKIYHDDDRRNECFRKYRKVDESYRDHSDFLRQGSRYSFLFKLEQGNYKGWARGLKRAGYATNPGYASMLINMIKENELHVYDELVISGKKMEKKKVYADTGINDEIDDYSFTEAPPVNSRDDNFVVSRSNRVKVRNRIEYIIVREGDTYKNVAEEFDLLRWELFRYNDLGEGADLSPGQLLYLQPKRNRAEVGNDFHIVSEGETMYSISQLYGIKLKSLYEKNNMEPGYIPPLGTELWLRKAKPEGL